MKETFIIRTEWYTAIAKLPEADQAVIFRNLFHYHSGNLDAIQTPSLAAELVWDIILPQLKRHIDSYDKRCETSKENGKLGGRPKKEEPKEPNPEPNQPNPKPNNHEYDSENDSVSDSVSSVGAKVVLLQVKQVPEVEISFDAFWDAYDKKVSKDKCEKKWKNLSKAERKAAMDYIPRYKQAQPDKKYRKNPETFLNNKSWQDELIDSFGAVQMEAPIRAAAGDDIRLNREKYLGIDDLL